MATTRIITIVLSLLIVLFPSPSISGSYPWPRPSSSHQILIEIALINPLDFHNVWLQLLSPLDCNLNDSTILDPKTQVLILLPANYPKFSPPPTAAFLPVDQKPIYFGELKRRYQAYLSSLPAEMRRFLMDVDPCKASTAGVAKSSYRPEVTSNDLRKLHGFIQRQNDKLRSEYQNAMENMAEAYLQLEKNVKKLTETVQDMEISMEKSRNQHPRNTDHTELEPGPTEDLPSQLPGPNLGIQITEPELELYLTRIKDWIQRFNGFWIILITVVFILVGIIFLLSLFVLMVLLCCHTTAAGGGGGVHGKDRYSHRRLEEPPIQHQYQMNQKPETV